jgi:hypothetical protein
MENLKKGPSPHRAAIKEMVAQRNSREALWVFSLGAFHEPIARLQGGIPLQHPPLATLTIVATAVGNRQLDIAHGVPCSAMRTAKVNVMAKLAAHRSRICDSTPKVAQTHHQSATMKQAAQPALTFTAPALNNALHCCSARGRFWHKADIR